MEKEHIEAAFQCAGVSFGDGINPPGQASVVDEKQNTSKVALFLATDDSEVTKMAKEKYLEIHTTHVCAPAF